MIEYFADLHVHIGRTSRGEAVKVSASPSLTFEKILREAGFRKGIDAVGIVDCASPGVLADIETMIEVGEVTPQTGGGLRYKDRLTLFLGVELEVQAGEGMAHYLCYLPHLENARWFSKKLSSHVTNIQLSSQRARLTSSQLLKLTLDAEGFFVVAHAFTPHKGYFGNCARRLSDVFSSQETEIICSIELGLSANTSMASRLIELDSKTFISNSDAHSAAKIAREYNRVRARDMSFKALAEALCQQSGGIVANYGLDPRLGKYHRTFCNVCLQKIPLTSDRRCPECGGNNIVVGVADRLEEIADRPEKSNPPTKRPPYICQVPLEFVPGVGPRTLDRLIEAFGSEMNVLHQARWDDLCEVVDEPVARRIIEARKGKLSLSEGAGGKYGRVADE